MSIPLPPSAICKPDHDFGMGYSQLSPVHGELGTYRERYSTGWTTGNRFVYTVGPGTTPATIQDSLPKYPGLSVVGRDGMVLPVDTDLSHYLDSGTDFKLYHPDAPYPTLVRYLPKHTLHKARGLGFKVYTPGATFTELCAFLESTGVTQAEFFADM
jgi:hypothetical protein